MITIRAHRAGACQLTSWTNENQGACPPRASCQLGLEARSVQNATPGTEAPGMGDWHRAPQVLVHGVKRTPPFGSLAFAALSTSGEGLSTAAWVPARHHVKQF